MTPSAQSGAPAGDEPAATPLAVELAKVLEVDLRTIRPAAGTGPITELDVREAVRAVADSARALDPVETVSLPRTLTQPTSQLLTLSTTTAVGAALTAVQDDKAMELFDAVVHSAASVLGRHPKLNAHLIDQELRLFEAVNLGFAVTLGDGQVFPVIRQAQQHELAELSRERRALSEKALDGDLKAWETDAATFAVADVGSLGMDILALAPIPPLVAMLAVGRLLERPALGHGGLVSRPELSLSLSVDSRVADAPTAARFLSDMGAVLERDCERSGPSDSA